jgi:hypothetical protein
MRTSRSYAPAMLFCAALVLAAAPADAQPRRGPWDQGASGGSYQHRAAWENGYQAGLSEGDRDARNGRRYDVRGSRTYRGADRGYDRRYGSRDQYRDVFRQGFEAGYRAGYDGSARGRAIPRREPGYGRSPDYGRYPDYGRSPQRTPGYGRGGPLYSVASDRGFADGYDKGRHDAQSGRRFDPARHKWHRSGDRGYDRRYGPREEYRAVYRQAFEAGYERAFRERARYGSRYPGQRTGGWRWPF